MNHNPKQPFNDQEDEPVTSKGYESGNNAFDKNSNTGYSKNEDSWSGNADTPSYSGKDGNTDAPSYSGKGGNTGNVSYSGKGGNTDTPSYSGKGSNADAPSYSGKGGDTGNVSYSGKGGNTDTPSYSGKGGNTDTPSYSGKGSNTGNVSYSGKGGNTDTPSYSGKGGNADAPSHSGKGGGGDTTGNGNATTKGGNASHSGAGTRGGNFSFDVRYDVQLVPQLTNMSCWAAGAAMLVGYRDQISINPSEIANGIGYWAQYVQGLLPSDSTMFAYWGLTPSPPQTYTPEGLRDLLESTHGPLWVATDEGAAHIRVITGILGDGTPEGTTLYINDPWPIGIGGQYPEPFRQFEAKQRQLATSEAGMEGLYIAHL